MRSFTRLQLMGLLAACEFAAAAVPNAARADLPIVVSNPVDNSYTPVGDASFTTISTDLSQSTPVIYQTPFSNQGVSESITTFDTYGMAGVPGNDPTASSQVLAQHSVATIGDVNGLVTVTSSVFYEFEVTNAASLEGIPTNSIVTLDISGLTSASGSGVYKATSEISFQDGGSPGSVHGDIFYSCSAGSGDVFDKYYMDMETVTNGCFTPVQTTASTASAWTPAATSGTLQFTLSTNVLQYVQVETIVTVFDDASTGYAFADPTITIDPSTPNASSYTITESANLVPEPASLALFGVALAGLRSIRRRRA